jgi:hypothetical protein
LEGERDSAAVAKLSAELFKSAPIADDALGQALASRLPPDCKAAASQDALGCVHRKLDDGDLYFVANTSNRALRTQMTFRSAHLNAEWWDPYSGEISKASGSTVALHLEPYESRLILFTKTPSTARSAPVSGETKTIADLSNDWKVTFTGLSQNSAMPKLESWTAAESTKLYSGQAVYETSITLTPDQLKSPLWLNFGTGTEAEAIGRRGGPSMRAQLDAPVREAAVVYVNGQRAGSVWRAPFEVNVSSLLKAGANDIRIVVANTAMNHMAGRPLPNYRLLNLRYGERFTPQDMNQVAALPSGILGGVKLLTH